MNPGPDGQGRVALLILAIGAALAYAFFHVFPASGAGLINLIR